MAGKLRHFLNRNGRYRARLVVPKALRGIIGKAELRTALGGDYREAVKRLPDAVAQFQHQIALAELKAGVGAAQGASARYPLLPEQIAYSHYMRRLAFDDELRDDPRYASISIDSVLVGRLRDAIAGRADDKELNDLIGWEVERFRQYGNHDAKPGTTEWRKIARALCHAELEALARAAERDEGDFSGTPASPIIRDATPPENASAPVSLSRLWHDYVATRKQAGFMRDGGRRQGSVIEALRKFLKHDDAARITRKDMIAWRDHLMQTKSAKTVSDVDLSTVRSLLSWAVENERLSENVAQTVRQPKPRKSKSREKGYTTAEAEALLKASRSYEPHKDEKGRVREKPSLIAAKRWVPIICAFSGARVAEITQMRKEDVRNEDGQWVVRITPDAGTVKSGGYRDVPLHPQIIEEGFIDFINSADPGPLFHNATGPEQYRRKAEQAAGQLREWLRANSLTPDGLQPNHAWRHRFKTQCRELGISDRVVDAIQGHAGKTASDDYGDVTLKTKTEAINRLSAYEV